MDLSVFDKEQLALLEDVSKFYTDRGLPTDEKMLSSVSEKFMIFISRIFR